jgi:hypothetical protein
MTPPTALLFFPAGSIKLFAALETALTALQQAEHVLHQHSTELAGIWATEDAAEFEAVAAELSLAFKSEPLVVNEWKHFLSFYTPNSID